MSLTMTTTELTVTGLIPMMYAALKTGEELENNVLNLLQFHFITPVQWYFSTLLYQIVVSLIPCVVNTIGMMIMLPDAFFASSE